MEARGRRIRGELVPSDVRCGCVTGVVVNRFAYLDFATPDAKTIAITLSENPLDGRRLLIKDGESHRYLRPACSDDIPLQGDNFDGRPAPEAGADPSVSAKPNLSGHTKTAQKILRTQKHSAGPTLFLGNLGFEATQQSIRQLFDSHRAIPTKPPSGAEPDSDAEEKLDADTDVKKQWIRKVRMGTFEDTGKCKGCVRRWRDQPVRGPASSPTDARRAGPRPQRRKRLSRVSTADR